MGCPLVIRRGQLGDADSGDDWADPAGAFPQGQDDQGDRAGPQGVPEHGPEGATLGRDLLRVRAERPAAAEAGAMDGGSRGTIDGERGEAHPRAADADPDFRGTARTWL